MRFQYFKIIKLKTSIREQTGKHQYVMEEALHRICPAVFSIQMKCRTPRHSQPQSTILSRLKRWTGL